MKNRVKELKKKSKINSRRTSRVNWNISSQAINAIEKEKFDPSLPTAFKMANLFKTTIEDIFTFSN